VKNRVLQLAYSMAGSGREVMMDMKGVKATPDGVVVNSTNVIAVEMEDLTEKDRNELKLEMQCDIEEIMAKKRDTRFHASRRPGRSSQERGYNKGFKISKLSFHYGRISGYDRCFC
jgi:hypothetical protein